MLRKLLVGAAIVTALLMTVLASAAVANPNDPGYWGDDCIKVEPVGTPTWTADQDYRLVVLKSATTNYEFYDVKKGDVLATPTGQDISHLILCTGEVPPSTTTTSTTTTTLPTTTTPSTTTSTTTTEPPGTTTTTDPSTTTTVPTTVPPSTTTTTDPPTTTTTTTTPPSTTTTETPSTTSTTVPPTTPTNPPPTGGIATGAGGTQLPNTGIPLGILAVIGVAAIVAGGLFAITATTNNQ